MTGVLFETLCDALGVDDCGSSGVVAACVEARWEFMGHGFHQIATHLIEDQRSMIAQTLDTLRAACGVRPVGWLGPGLTETLETPDLLAEAGMRYLADWVVDDLPCALETSHGPLLTMPYSVELNDIPIMAIQHPTAADLANRTIAQFDRLVAEDETSSAKVMGLAVHPYLTGVPNPIAAFERALANLTSHPGAVFMQGRQIMDWYLAACGGAGLGIM